MIEWNEYINQLLSSGTDFDNMTISLDEGSCSTEIPPIIKASITMLDKMIEHQGRLNLMVFPEKMQSVFIFTLMKLFHNISQGKIVSSYDPTGFSVGEKLKVGNAVVEYLGIEERNDSLCLMIKLADLDKDSAPIDTLPIFQKVETKRHLSKYSQYVSAKKVALAGIRGESTGNEKIAYVAEMKTHMNSSIFAMTSLAAVKDQLSCCTVDGKKVTKIFHIAQADYEGNITNISPGQMSGVPAIVFASDLYAICAAIEKGAPVQSLIIDGSNANALTEQLDALDNLIKLNIPIVCITDIANSFELEPYSARGFNVWRWGQETLTDKLYDAVPLSSDKRVKNCAKQSVLYLKSDGKEISAAMKLLAAHRRETQEQSSQMMRLFEKLNSLTFTALRTTTDLSDMDREIANRTLDECEALLALEKRHLLDVTVDDYSMIIENLYTIYGDGFSFTKSKVLQDYLRKKPGKKIYLIVPEKSPRDQIQRYWDQQCLRIRMRNHVRVLFPSEYYSWPMDGTDITVICGWMKRAIMRKLIYSFNTSEYVVLLYDYENKWKNHDAARWNKALRSSSNKAIIEKAFSFGNIQVSTERYNQEPVNEEAEEKVDELGEIELILRENKFRQYINSGSSAGKEVVSAIPINFVGGYLAFYRVGHKLISATKIISSSYDKIESKLPTELAVGDFIVVRESDKDIIRELADIVLKNSGKRELRELATKWREALKNELLFCTVDDLYEKMKAGGCDKGLPTIRRWIEDEDIIAPQSKEDLQIIASVTKNEMLIELLDDVFEAAQEVRKAHVLAGRKLSEQLKHTLAREIKKYEDIDPFNFWEPIDMNIEGIGSVKVLKIIDIGSEVEVASTDTNRLIED
jgi:hypothetical protein